MNTKNTKKSTKKTGNSKSKSLSTEKAKPNGSNVDLRPLTTVDLAIFTVFDSELCVLLIERPKREPFAEYFALPGGIVDIEQDQNLVSCAKRKLQEKTGVGANYLEQVGSWGDASRDPRGWSTTHVYFALVPYTASQTLEPGSSWVNVETTLKKNYKLAFDHKVLLNSAIQRLRDKVEYTSLPAYLLDAPFTMPQLQQTYEVVLNRPLDKSSFRTRTLSAGYLEETGLMKVEAPRPAMGYKIVQGSALVIFPRPLKGT